jgi:hypothetical protein
VFYNKSVKRVENMGYFLRIVWVSAPVIVTLLPKSAETTCPVPNPEEGDAVIPIVN